MMNIIERVFGGGSSEQEQEQFALQVLIPNMGWVTIADDFDEEVVESLQSKLIHCNPPCVGSLSPNQICVLSMDEMREFDDPTLDEVSHVDIPRTHNIVMHRARQAVTQEYADVNLLTAPYH